MRLALAVALLLFAPAGAQAEWSGQTLSSPHSTIDSPAVIVAGGGGALASWRFQQGLGNGSRAGTEGAVRPAGAAGFTRRVAIVPAKSIDRPLTTLAGLEPYGADGAIQALILPGPGDAPQARIGVRFGKVDGRFGKVRTIALAPKYSILRASLAVNARGDAALAWFENRGVRTDRVYVALRRAGHGFGKPVRLATGRIRDVAAAVGERGQVLVSWDARGVLRTRFRARGAHGFGATDTIRSRKTYNADMHPVITPSGRAVLAWSAQFTSEGGTRGPVYFELANRPRGAKRFRPARLLERVDGAQGDSRPIEAVADIHGIAVAWSTPDGRVRGMRGDGPAQDIGTGTLSDLAIKSGVLLAVWDDGLDAVQSVVHAALAERGSPFGAPEDVSAAGRDSRSGAAAFVGDRPLVVLSSREGRGMPVAQAYVR